MLPRPRSRRHEIGDKNEKQQCIEDNADNCWGKNALRAVLGNAEQRDDTESEANDHEEKRDILDENFRADAAAESDEKKDNGGAGPTALRGLMCERSGLWW